MDLPMKPLPCMAGYFLMADVSGCKDLIPEKYFKTHDYEPDTDDMKEKHFIKKHEMYMPKEKRIPLNLAFVRWMAVENKVTMMPNCFFYHKDSPHIDEKHVRLAICMKLETTKKVCARLISCYVSPTTSIKDQKFDVT